MAISPEEQARFPVPVNRQYFNPSCILPYGLEVEHLFAAMTDFVRFLSFINQQLATQEIPRLESFLMPANFSSIVGEFLSMTIPRYCSALVKNRFHNGHPDLIPNGIYPDNAVQHATEGIEIKASRRASGWQGHNPESVWLLLFHIDSNSASEPMPVAKPFQFKGVYAAKLEREDWTFSGRSATSRRTITASVNGTGAAKMKGNWVYRTPL